MLQLQRARRLSHHLRGERGSKGPRPNISLTPGLAFYPFLHSILSFETFLFHYQTFSCLFFAPFRLFQIWQSVLLMTRSKNVFLWMLSLSTTSSFLQSFCLFIHLEWLRRQLQPRPWIRLETWRNPVQVSRLTLISVTNTNT